MSVDVRHSLRAAGIGFALALMPYVACAQQDEHIFEPGKKHVCVPAADRKSWNCGSADNPPAATPKADGPALRSARATDLSDSERAAAAAAMEPAAAPSEPPAAIASPSSGSASGRSVPSYLLAPEAASVPVASSAPPPAPKSEPPPAAPVEAKPVAAAPVEVKAAEPPPVDTKPAAPPPLETAAPVATEAKPPAPEPERVVTQAKPAAPEPPTTAPKPRAPEPPAAVAAPTEPPAAIAAPVATEVSSEPVVAPKAAEAMPQAAPPSEPVRRAAPSLRHADAFRTLADTRYVLELARGADRSAVEAAAAQATLPRGEVYLLALTRDGASWYVALWGDFDSIDSARAARGEALASGIADVGWPRRVGPLKQELKLVR